MSLPRPEFRAGGGTVVLITNAPRPGDFVQQFIDRLNVPRESYDAIVSSGDVTRSHIRPGERVAHIGPARDLPIFDGLGAEVVPIESAAYVVCSGLYDDTKEKPEDYDALLATMLARGLTMVCANPDVVVERGEHLVYCAGAIADRYSEKGGSVVFAGKPYRPIYEQAMAAARKARGRDIDHARVLAIGDSVRTDLTRDNPDLGALAAVFAEAGVAPKLVMRQLVW
jgi:HAD superfamily hydrolase (TIGR01459 family)